MADKDKGFTLVELLVVIAIITILAAMLLPIVEKSLAFSRQNACGNNERQLYVSLEHSASEQKDAFSKG